MLGAKTALPAKAELLCKLNQCHKEGEAQYQVAAKRAVPCACMDHVQQQLAVEDGHDSVMPLSISDVSCTCQGRSH